MNLGNQALTLKFEIIEKPRLSGGQKYHLCQTARMDVAPVWLKALVAAVVVFHLGLPKKHHYGTTGFRLLGFGAFQNILV